MHLAYVTISFRNRNKLYKYCTSIWHSRHMEKCSLACSNIQDRTL